MKYCKNTGWWQKKCQCKQCRVRRAFKKVRDINYIIHNKELLKILARRIKDEERCTGEYFGGGLQ